MPDIDEALRTHFGLSSFHAWQREAIEALLDGPGRVLVVAPTGGGKSLTYQVPAAVLEGTTLVLSPLVALMEDQVRALGERGVPATFLASTLPTAERNAREGAMMRGSYKLVYVAPERLASDVFVNVLLRSRIALVAIDEAHCIAQWGHDFRPDYLRIGALLDRLRPRRVLACTATATPEVRREIRAALGLETPACHEVLRGFARPNLHLAAESVEGPKEARAKMIACLTSALGDARAPRGAAIVYAATRKSTEQLAVLLRQKGWNAGAYHAGMEAAERTKTAHGFATRTIDVVCATNAFGMGIDRADIRAVVHFQPPSSIEAYYQEVGRAGRDGKEASGLLLCSGADIALRRRLVQSGGEGAASDPALAAKAWELFRELLRYLDARTCRHDFVLRYFGDEQELLGGCGHCDVCLAFDGERADDENEGQAETTLLVRKALSGVARAQKRAGLGAIAEMLHGTSSARMDRFGFSDLSTFGLLREHSREWLTALLRAMLAAGWIDLTTTDHPVPFLTRSGVEVMSGRAPARILLPVSARAPRRGPRPVGDDALLDPTARALFERLRVHRADVARARGVPAYVIALDKTLVQMARDRPTSTAALLGVHGMGPARAEQYGEGFLRILCGA